MSAECVSIGGFAGCPECGTMDWVFSTDLPVASDYDDHDLACLRCKVGFNKQSRHTESDQ